MSRFDVTKYELKLAAATKKIRIAVLADLHSRAGSDILAIAEEVRRLSPDIALFPGDTFERLDGSAPERKQRGFELIEKVAKICPVYLSVGNHENGGDGSWNPIKWMRIKSITHKYDEGELQKIRDLGGVWLDDGYVECQGIRIGGLSSGLINEGRMPRLEWLEDFCSFEGIKILMCHHPEYYKKYLRGTDIDLVVSGHAHGGQWRIFGRGVFAPGQGIFPKYTSGVHDGRLVVSRGLKPSGRIPRIFNTPEIVCLDVFY